MSSPFQIERWNTVRDDVKLATFQNDAKLPSMLLFFPFLFFIITFESVILFSFAYYFISCPNFLIQGALVELFSKTLIMSMVYCYALLLMFD